ILKSMKKYCIALLMLLCSRQGFGQKLGFTTQEQADINKYFLLPNAEIFEAEAVSHENYEKKEGGICGLLTLNVLKSFDPRVECGRYEISTPPVGGILHKLNGQKSKITMPHKFGFKEKALFSCTRKNGIAVINNAFLYNAIDENVPHRAVLAITRTLQIVTDDYANLYTLLPKPVICGEKE
ncbi:MAG: hypothetical protein V4543_17355, partial [Bacteroidota bacterium]